MAELLGSTETEFETDFAILYASQGDERSLGPSTFAVSMIGALFAVCGTKYARVHVRAERWSARPEFSNSWEDSDELPFEAIAEGGPLQICGFDPPLDGHGLDLEGFGAGRELVLARGRHRYDYSRGNPTLAPEEWLLQFFPEDGAAMPLSGPPRRLLNYSPFNVNATSPGWSAALHAWRQTGWDAHLSSSPGFHALRPGMGFAGKAISGRNLAEKSIPHTLNGAARSVPAIENPLEAPLRQQQDDPLALAFGSPLRTLGSAIEAMRRLQLLLEVEANDGPFLVPNPAPGFVWERLALSAQRTEALRIQIGNVDYQDIAAEIALAVRWARDAGLRTTVQEMGIRWSAPSSAIRGGLAIAAMDGGISIDPPLTADAGYDVAPITLSLRG